MTKLIYNQILQGNNIHDPNSVTSLTLTHKALTDVSCLSEFQNLQRLDLGFNNLTSLEGLNLCVNLKWLSVVQNKLQSLKGIEGLSKLTVLNAGKNKLKSMNEVGSLQSLCALILNDNEIASICKLDQLKELNTLVLSRNPICEIGKSLEKCKSITKLSLSNCQLQSISSSLKSCTELRELRLAHNDIKALPSELAHHIKLQSLDIGNNLITKWSDLKVVSSLANLKNFNLLGNPVADKDNLVEKIKKLAPSVQIFNSKPINKMDKVKAAKINDSYFDGNDELVVRNDSQKNGALRHEKPGKSHLIGESEHVHPVNASDLEVDKKPKSKKHKSEIGKELAQDPNEKSLEKKKTKLEKVQKSKSEGEERKATKQKKSEISEEKSVDKEDTMMEEPNRKKQKEIVKQNKVNVIDDGETSFLDLFASDWTEVPGSTSEKDILTKAARDIDVKGTVTQKVIKKKNKNRSGGIAALQVLEETDFGLGGPSTWD